MNHHSELSVDEEYAEQFEIAQEPYIGPKALWLIIRHRVKHHKEDEQLQKYYQEQSGLKAQFKQFTKAVRNRWG